MHVYAPGQKEYIPVSVDVDIGDGLKVHPARLPPAEKYLFTPLNETPLVHSRPFRVVQDVTIPLSPAIRERSRAATRL